MTGQLLWRGMLAGLLAALLSTLFARAVAEPQIDLAIGVEQSRAPHVHDGMDPGAGQPAAEASAPADSAPDLPAEEELVSRDVQKGIGLLTAMALYGAAVGGLFALLFAFGYGRLARIGPRSLSLALAAAGFLLIVVVPSLKYPQTPPAVGQHETVGMRTLAYFAMIALSLLAAAAAHRLGRVLATRLRRIDALLLSAGAYLLLVLLGQRALPVVNEVPPDFPATLLWDFRIAALGTQAVLWAVLGVAFGWAAERLLNRQH